MIFNDEDFHDGYIEINFDFFGEDVPWDISEYIGADHPVIFNHSWAEEGTYTIKVRAVDIFGGISDWQTMEVSIPKPKTHNPTLFELIWQRLITRFPFLSEILNLK